MIIILLKNDVTKNVFVNLDSELGRSQIEIYKITFTVLIVL